MSISPEGERVMDTTHQMPLASMDVQVAEAPQFDIGTLARTGDAVITHALSAPAQPSAQDSEPTLSDGRRWSEYSMWPERVLGKRASALKAQPVDEQVTTDGRPWSQYSSWNPYA